MHVTARMKNWMTWYVQQKYENTSLYLSRVTSGHESQFCTMKPQWMNTFLPEFLAFWNVIREVNLKIRSRRRLVCRSNSTYKALQPI
jgi:hypothetical protein